jgi:conjugative transfer signal peptidase TraF
MTFPQSEHVLGALTAGVMLLVASTLPLPCCFVYNPTLSAPIGWYAIGSVGALHAHDMVLARLPVDAATLADRRQYLPRGTPVLKEIGALEGQTVCVANGVVSIDGQRLATTRDRDGLGRPLVSWNGCRALVAGELFLLSRTSLASFDSRYFGPITRDAVIGKATPLWTW